MLKRLALGIAIVALAWSAYWFWGRSSLMSAYDGWFAERRAEGWHADYDKVAIRGFPNRHDTTWEGVSIADPNSGLAWQAPFFQLFLLTYNRNHAIAAWPDKQVITTPAGSFELASERLQASVVTDGTGHDLRRANLAAEHLNITFDEATTAMAQLRLAIKFHGQAKYDIGFAVAGLALPQNMLTVTGGALPGVFQKSQFSARVEFDAPWQLASIEVRPQPRRIALNMAELEWGPMALRVTGALEIDDAGRGTGDLHLQVKDWREMLALVRASGRVADVVTDGLEATFSLMSQLSGKSSTLDVTLQLNKGVAWLGPLPLGEAPRFRLP